MKFNHLTVLEDLGGSKVLCQCDCENKTILECYKSSVKSGRHTSCGCTSRKKRVGNYEGQQFGNWIILKELGGGKVLCQCQCENKTERVLYKKAVLGGQTKSCGCLRAKNCNDTKKETGSLDSKYVGQHFGEWEVLERIPNSSKVLCRCSCGVEKEVYIQHLLDGSAKSCGHDKNSLVGQKFGEWTVTEELGHGKVRCDCSCGKTLGKVLYKSTLTRGQSKSCGCKSKMRARQTMIDRYGDVCTLKVDKPREEWQIQTINNKEALVSYIKSLDHKPQVQELSLALGVNKSSILRALHRYDIFDMIEVVNNESYMEIDVYNYIKSIYNGEIRRSCRDIIGNNLELDIHIPEKKIAIEFNGVYWHSETFKEKDYHQKKSLLCIKNGIRLVHIFEYEWINNTDEVKDMLHDLLCDRQKIYARTLSVEDVENAEVKEFYNKNHIQHSINAKVNIVLRDNNKEILGAMSFGDNRFSCEADYEMYRMCFKKGIEVVGGTSKLFKYFIDEYSPESVVTYCDLSKFTGGSYLKLGFKPVSVTEPGYVWCNNHYKVLSRYETQRHKLYELGYTDKSMSEDDIMHKLGYMKIYNSGNLKLIWSNNERK